MHMTSPRLLDRGPAIARRFGIRTIPANPALHGLPQLALKISTCLQPGRLVLITGASGSGKSSLLAHLERLLAHRALMVHAIGFPDAIAVDCLPEVDTQGALELLARFGLGEVYTYLSPARKLSTGQQFRLRLAMAWARALTCPSSRVLLCDEFATQLDRITAGVLGRLTRRQISADSRLCFVAVSCHEEIAQALKPDLTVHCDFGQSYLVSEQAA
jgi:ABC-type ATPase with predicted acetyltransferase domain